LDAIETAIRGALAKGDADDRAFREKVYRSVFAALERHIAANPGLGAEGAQRRREVLKAKITEIEQEFVPAVEPAVRRDPPMTQAETPRNHGGPDIGVPEVGPDVGAPGIAARQPQARPDGERRDPAFGRFEPVGEPTVEPDARFARDESPEFGDRATAGDFAVAPEPDRDMAVEGEWRERPRRRWGMVFLIIALLAALGIGGWLAVELGLVGAPRDVAGDTAAPSQSNGVQQPDAAEAPPPLGPGTADATREWVIVFSPADPVSVVAPAGARADILDEEGAPFIRIQSGPGGEAILFDVGPGILERLAGQRAVFDVVARAPDDQETQISIQCNFGELGDCGRRRYMVAPGTADYLFEVELPEGKPSAAGTIAIASDVDGGSKAIDIFEIKVSLSE